MRPRAQLFLVKLRLSLRSIAWLLRQPKYAALAVIVSLFFFEFVYWMFNLSTLSTLMVSPALSVFDKAALLASPFLSLSAQNGPAIFTMMIILSVLQGVSVAALTYVIRRQPKVDNKIVGGSTLAGLLAVIGLGCPACGTSLVTPIVALFVTGSAVSIAEAVTAVALPVALLVGLYGVYTVGLHVANARMRT